MNPFEFLPSNALKKIIHDTGELTKATKISGQFRFEAYGEAQAIMQSLFAQHNPQLIDIAFQSLKAPSDASYTSVVDVFFKEAKKFCPDQKLDILTKADPYHPALFGNYLHAFVRARDLEIFFRTVMAQALPALKQSMSQAKFVDDPLEKYEQMKSFFDQHVQELSSMTSLVIKHASLRTLPAEIGLFANLKSLNLSNNQISSLPPALFLLKELATVNLDHNGLLELPAGISNLENLEYLLLNNNKIRQLPLQMAELVNLKCLFINNNLFSHLPPWIGNLASLTFLSASGNRLTTLPDSVEKLIFLEHLHLSGNKISELPLNLKNLQSLQVLSLIDNKLNRFPSQIMALNNLKILMLSQNAIRFFPATLGEMPNLEELDAGDNRLLLSYNFPKLKYCRAEANTRISNRGQIDFRVPLSTFSRVYNALGEHKWMEFVEGTLHMHGPYVFDQGVYSENAEPGFAASMESAYEFLGKNFDRELDAEFYLNLHRHTCSHFDGPATETLIGKDKVGFFRGSATQLNAVFSAASGYEMSQEAIDEFNELNRWITYRFGPSFALGHIQKTSDSPMEHRIIYHPMSQEQVKILFTFFVSEFHFELSNAKDKRQDLVAIGKLIRRLEWLHPVIDGSGRTDTALLNYLLAKYGHTPVLLDYPYRSSCRGLNEWLKELEEGMSKWKIQANAQFNLKLLDDQGRNDVVIDFSEMQFSEDEIWD